MAGGWRRFRRELEERDFELVRRLRHVLNVSLCG
jgi:hypothetical protein